MKQSLLTTEALCFLYKVTDWLKAEPIAWKWLLYTVWFNDDITETSDRLSDWREMIC